ncbi:dihydrolipoamide acetyltransferase family protein [Actinopolymorpha sp. B9G3]|uniref:dihydrolipoamide acetyltransferase family protein n=1 Tax=Actinopolymorpha sp. B9G3 TaxID=3158970 RepID=UPI0032D8B955
MANVREFKLPDVGEGLVEAEVVTWKVKPGDTVKVNDIVVEIETAKSLVELPCPYAGTIAELLVPEGQVVPVGTPLIRVAGEGVTPDEAAWPGGGSVPAAGPGEAPAAGPGEAPATGPAKAPAAGPGEAPPAAAGAPAAAGGEANGEGRTSNLVGYGPRAGAARRRPRKGATVPVQGAPAEVAAPPAPAEWAPAATAPGQPSAAPASAPGPAPAPSVVSTAPARAKPPVRKLAKDLGVDLRTVPPTGPDGTISRSDVESFATQAAGPAAPAAPAEGLAPAARAPGVRETRVPVRGVRRAMAQAVTQSAFTAPHVTEWMSVDATNTMDLLARLKGRRELADVKLTPLVVVAKACLLALRRTPELNSTWDDAASEIVLKHYVNLGIAAATPRGLTVPHIKDAEQLPLPDLARALNALTQTAREGRTAPEDMVGTTFTITNVGVFGVDGGTPIMNPGESGILAFGAVRKQPWVVDDQVVPRWVTTLSLSFDHRVVDGEQGSRFLTDVARIVEDPANALLLA